MLIDIIFGNPHISAYVKAGKYSVHLTEICKGTN